MAPVVSRAAAAATARPIHSHSPGYSAVMAQITSTQATAYLTRWQEVNRQEAADLALALQQSRDAERSRESHDAASVLLAVAQRNGTHEYFIDEVRVAAIRGDNGAALRVPGKLVGDGWFESPVRRTSPRSEDRGDVENDAACVETN